MAAVPAPTNAAPGLAFAVPLSRPLLLPTARSTGTSRSLNLQAGAADATSSAHFSAAAVGFGVTVGVGMAAATAGTARARRSIRQRRSRGRFSVPVIITRASAEGITGPSMNVVVFGATGYIGRAVVQELVERGHTVTAFTREKSGIGAKQSIDEVKANLGDKVNVVAGDVTDAEALTGALAKLAPVDAVMCCLASRSGGREDSFLIDYQATVNCVNAARACQASRFVLLSAVCVQRPLLAFQEAKLQAEAEITGGNNGNMKYSIVRPTAFFKSLLGQVKGVKGGAPFVMFGDGNEVKCKPISEQDLAAFMADCLWDPAKENAVLPIGGPGPAMSFREQGELLYKLAGREPSFICVPYGVFDVVQGLLDFIAGLNSGFSDVAEYGRIGRYYAEQSMLVLDPKTGQYSEELTPGYGRTTLKDFLTEAMQDESKLEAQKLGEQGLGNRIGINAE